MNRFFLKHLFMLFLYFIFPPKIFIDCSFNYFVPSSVYVLYTFQHKHCCSAGKKNTEPFLWAKYRENISLFSQDIKGNWLALFMLRKILFSSIFTVWTCFHYVLDEDMLVCTYITVISVLCKKNYLAHVWQFIYPDNLMNNDLSRRTSTR